VRQGAQDYLLCEPDLDRVLARTAWCAVERHRRWVQLRDLSLTDPLTGLYNRRGFRALAEAHLRTLRRTRRQSLLVCADLDGLKEINDHHGHPAGDRALIEVARLMRRCFRESDILARYGGDEFVALAQDATRNASRKLVLRVERGLDELNASARLPYNLALSVGTVVFGGRSSQSLATLMALADRALYREKQRGGRRPPARREVLARCA
jgi:diguanylate cyclase (GGDEF)-like protein